MTLVKNSIVSFPLLIFCSFLLYEGSAVRLVLNNDYILDYNLINNNRSIEFVIQATNITGWVGIGVNNRTGSMPGSDIFIGGVHPNRTVYGKDYHVPINSGNTRPTLDVQQNWELLSASETNNVTSVRVRRLLITPDRLQDVDILNNTMYLIWAYHNNSDSDATRHTVRGSRQVNFLGGGVGPGPTTTSRPPTRPTVPVRSTTTNRIPTGPTIPVRSTTTNRIPTGPTIPVRSTTTNRSPTGSTTKRSSAGLIRNGFKTTFICAFIVSLCVTSFMS